MSYLPRIEFDCLFTSQNAVWKSNDGSSFDVVLDADGFDIPPNAENIQCGVISSELWWNTPNVTTENNEFKFSFNGGTSWASVLIPTGIYSIQQLDKTIDIFVKNLTGLSGLFNLSSDDAQGKTVMTFTRPTDAIDFSITTGFGKLLGFNNVISGTPNLHNISPNIALFSDVSYFLVQCQEICDQGISINGQYDSILARILITAHPGSQILYIPQNYTLCDASPLKNSYKKRIRFTLLTNDKKNANTQGEYWSIQLRISYLIQK